ncbi:MAG: BTAD domain-containing putative transcriptional regulator [Solirubrobacteraceae bacterium]
MQFRILGPLEVAERDAVWPLGGAKQRAVLAILLIHRGELLSSERLIDELWGERPPLTAAKTLQGYISRLRKLIGEDVLVTHGRGYRLSLAPGQLDVDEFERLAADGRRALSEGDPAGAAKLLREALGLWRGAALADLAYESFAQSEVARLEEARLAALEDRIDADLGRGDHSAVIGTLEPLIAEHPYRERLRGQLMLALYRCDRQADALHAYQSARRALVEELGIEPGARLRELERSILAQDARLEWAPGAIGPRWVVERSEIRRVSDAGPSGGSFVGRERELAEVLGGLEGALARRPSLFLLAGEPGIGKSRLADEVTSVAIGRGARVLWGRCWEAGGAPAYWPWAQALRAYIRDGEKQQVRRELGPGATDVAQMLPELHELFPDLPPLPSVDSDGARFRLFDSTASFLRAVSEAQPLVLVIDDLHAADAPSLLLLRFLARELGEARIVLLVAYRDTEAGPDDALSVTVAELRREPIARLVRLGGLALPAVASCIELIVGASPSEGLAVAVHGETEGNPLFVNELVRLLASEGRLEEAASAPWRASIPQGMREVIARRLHHLSRDCKRLLSVASILGREFRLDALEQVSQRSGEELLGLLDEALAARVIGDVPAGRGRLRFSHALIRDSLYGELGMNERLRLHQRAAEVLETIYCGNREPHLAELAHHFFRALPLGDADAAVRYSQSAAERAVASLAFEEGLRLYSTALEANELRPGEERTSCGLLLAVGEAKIRSGDSAGAKDTFLQAAELARRLGLSDELARAALGYGGRLVYARAGGDERLIPLLEDGLTAVGAGDCALRARLLARLACAKRDEFDREPRFAFSREAVEVATRVGEPDALAYALNGSYAAAWWPENPRERIVIADELARLANRVGDKERVVEGGALRSLALIELGERTAPAQLDAQLRLAQELRQPVQLWLISLIRTLHALLDGQLEAAEESLAEGLQHGQQAFPDEALNCFRLQTFAVRRDQGRLLEIADIVSRMAAEYTWYPMWRCVLACVQAELGDEGEARSGFDALAAAGFAVPRENNWLFSLAMLTEVCVFLGDSDRATVLYDLLAPFVGRCASSPEICVGSVSRSLGMLATLMSCWEQAEVHFDEAVAMNRRLRSAPCVAHTQVEHARMLSARGEPDDVLRAGELLGGALEVYDRLGLAGWEARASRIREQLDSTRPVDDAPARNRSTADARLRDET